MKTLNIIEQPGLATLAAVCYDLPEEEKVQYRALIGQGYDAEGMAATLLLIPGPKWGIANADDTPIVVGGYTQERPGVWRSWMLAREVAWAEYGEEVTNIVQGVMEMMFADFKAHRLETLCMADRVKARRWYERHLGLQCEGVLRAAGVAKEDVAVYAKVRD